MPLRIHLLIKVILLYINLPCRKTYLWAGGYIVGVRGGSDGAIDVCSLTFCLKFCKID